MLATRSKKMQSISILSQIPEKEIFSKLKRFSPHPSSIYKTPSGILLVWNLRKPTPVNQKSLAVVKFLAAAFEGRGEIKPEMEREELFTSQVVYSLKDFPVSKARGKARNNGKESNLKERFARARTVNLQQIIETHYPRPKRGKHLYLCPFHDDRNPSMSVFQLPNGEWRFYCFGCGAKGTPIDFVMKMEKLPSPVEALKLIESWEGQLHYSDNLPRVKPEKKKASGAKTQSYALNLLARARANGHPHFNPKLERLIKETRGIDLIPQRQNNLFWIVDRFPANEKGQPFLMMIAPVIDAEKLDYTGVERLFFNRETRKWEKKSLGSTDAGYFCSRKRTIMPKVVVVTEGVFDALAVEDGLWKEWRHLLGEYIEVVSSLGVSRTKGIITLAKDNPDSTFVILSDSDQAGDRFFEEIYDAIPNAVRFRLKGAKDPNEYLLEKGAGELAWELVEFILRNKILTQREVFETAEKEG